MLNRKEGREKRKEREKEEEDCALESALTGEEISEAVQATNQKRGIVEHAVHGCRGGL